MLENFAFKNLGKKDKGWCLQKNFQLFLTRYSKKDFWSFKRWLDLLKAKNIYIYIICIKFLNWNTEARFPFSFCEYFLFNCTNSVKGYSVNARYVVSLNEKIDNVGGSWLKGTHIDKILIYSRLEKTYCILKKIVEQTLLPKEINIITMT